MQGLLEYAESKYDDLCRTYAEECPYNVDTMKPAFLYKQVYSWFMTEKVLLSTGKTILEEFVESRVQPENPELARKILQMKDVTRGTFEVLDIGTDSITVEHKESGRKYEVVPISEEFRKLVRTGDVITKSRIHPWGDRYKFGGIISIQERDEETARRLGLVTPEMTKAWLEKGWAEEAESMLVNQNTRLGAAMNRYPWQWVDGICRAIQIEPKGMKKRDKVRRVVSKLESGYAEELLRNEKKIPKGSVEALRSLADNGFVMKYGDLSRRFTSEAGFWWNERPATSEIGLLRLHGFVVVGKMPKRGRLYKVAMVPLELRAAVSRSLLHHRHPAASASGPSPSPEEGKKAEGGDDGGGSPSLGE